MTWLQLWKKIGKQPLRLTRQKDVTIEIQGVKHKCDLVYVDNGNDWHLVIKE